MDGRDGRTNAQTTLRNGGGRVLAKTRARSVHSIIPKEREWLSVLVCVNAAGFHIPNFYIFCDKSFQRDYIKQCEDNASMAMQEKAWMTGHLFKSWIGHFVKNVRDCGLQISLLCRHLLILDGHGSHVTMDVVKKACSVGLDLLTLPSIHPTPCSPWTLRASSHSSSHFVY
jgi:hypothetical protein